MNSFRTMLTLTTVAALAVGASGCTTTDRAGGKAADPVTTLSFAQPNDGDPPEQIQAWADAVEQASEGSISIEFENGWRMGETSYETATIADVAAGEFDLAWVGARAFDRVGVTDFQALLAPTMVDSHDLQAAVFADGIPSEMLEGVTDAGVTGIGVLPGPMRKLLGVDHAFLSPADFEGQLIGMQDSALTERAMGVLGADVVAMPSGARLGDVDGYEQQIASIFGNGYADHAGFVTANLDLWPRALVLIANPAALDDLSEDQQAVLHKAAADAVEPALEASRAEDSDAVANVCRRGMSLPAASSQELATLVEAWQPVYDELAADSDTAGWLDRIQVLKTSVGARPDTAACSSDEPSSVSDDPVEGEYVATNDWPNVDSADASCVGGPESETVSVYELSLHDGFVDLKVRIGGPDAPREHGYSGTYRVFRDQIELTDNTPLTAHVDVDDERLVLSDMTGGQCGDWAIWTTSPWVRVEDEAPTDELVGLWTAELTASDWSDAGFDGPAGRFTMSFEDGWVRVVDPSGETGYQGSYLAFRGRLTTSDSIDELRASYRVSGDRLYLTDVSVPGVDDGGPYIVVWASHPWTRQPG